MKTLIFLAVGAVCAAASTCSAADSKPGVHAEFFDRLFALTDFPTLSAEEKPDVSRIDPQIGFEPTDGGIDGTDLKDYVYVRWTGQIKIEKAGKYTFFTQSDDGSRVFIDDKQIIDNGGIHAEQEKSGEVDLTAGMHEIKVDYIENDAGAVCRFLWQTAGVDKQIVPANVLFHNE